MEDFVVDAGFIRSVVHGSANIDCLRREIHAVVSIVLGHINQNAEDAAKFNILLNQSSPPCDQAFIHLLEHSRFVEHTLCWAVFRAEDDTNQVSFLKKKKQPVKLTIQLQGNISPYDEDSDLFQRTLYQYGEQVPLVYVRYVHSQLPNLVRWIISVVGKRSELVSTLRLLARAA